MLKLAAEKMAHEKPGQTLQATALVHEAYLRLVDVTKVQHWNSRGHFFSELTPAAAAWIPVRSPLSWAQFGGRGDCVIDGPSAGCCFHG
jgi:hypothetical protein